MSINRVPSVPFAQIANSALRDSRLSYKARGILAMVLSNVGEWEATAEWIEKQSELDGKHAIQSALNELTRYGYRVVGKERRPNGQVFTVVDWFHEPPIIRSPENPVAGLSDRRETGASLEDHPSEHHLEEDHGTRTPVRKPVNLDDEPFRKFWDVYPKKTAKAAARIAWAKAVLKADSDLIIQAATSFRDDPSREDKFTPYPATWLNAERWLDEPTKTQPSGPATYMEQVAEEPCQHGEPRGPRMCPLCRVSE